MDIRSDFTGAGSKVFIFAMATLFFAPLLPEYIGPLFTVILAIAVLISLLKHNKSALIPDKYGIINAVYIAYGLISVLYSKNPLSSLGFVAIYAFMFLGQLSISSIATTKRRLLYLLHMILFSGAVVSLIGILQFVTRTLYYKGIIPFAMPSTFYGNADRIVYDFFSGMGLSIKYSTFMFRASGTFSNPNIYVGFLLVCFPIGTYYMLRAKKRKMKILYIACVILTLGGIAVSQSRSAIISVALSVIFIVLGNRKHMRKLLIVLAGLVGISSMVVLRMLKTDTGKKQFNATFFGHPFTLNVNASTHTHLTLYQTVITQLTSNIPAFFFGLGFGTENTFEFFKEHGINQPHAHNIILQLWLEGGLVGITLFILSIAIIFYDLIKVMRMSPESRYVSVVVMASFVGFFSFCIFDYILFDPKIVQIFYFLCGLAAATIRLYSKKEIENAVENS
jgi:O-antigen ligase